MCVCGGGIPSRDKYLGYHLLKLHFLIFYIKEKYVNQNIYFFYNIVVLSVFFNLSNSSSSFDEKTKNRVKE